MSQSQLGVLALGQENSSVIQSMRRGSSPSVEKAQAICQALGLEMYIGPKRPALTDSELLATDSEFVKVNRYDVQLSAGDGNIGDNAEPLAPVAFRASWMRDRGLKAKSCCVVGVKGDSMLPTLDDGDLVLVDCTEKPLRSLDIYAFVDAGGDAKVKRFETAEDRLFIRSDNLTYPTDIRIGDDANALKIIGKVVWAGHEID